MIKEEAIDYGILEEAIHKYCLRDNLKDVDGKLIENKSFLFFSVSGRCSICKNCHSVSVDILIYMYSEGPILSPTSIDAAMPKGTLCILKW